MVGLYLSFINPKKFVFYFEDEKYVYTGLEKFIIVDMFFHVAVFAFIWTKYAGYYMEKNATPWLGTLSILAVYAALVPLDKVYGITYEEMISLFIVCTAGFFVVMNLCTS